MPAKYVVGNIINKKNVLQTAVNWNKIIKQIAIKPITNKQVKIKKIFPHIQHVPLSNIYIYI
jgi:hypothetical protein